MEARLKPGHENLYPAVQPHRWYPVLLDGEFRDDLEGFWIRVDERVSYVLARHFDLQVGDTRH